MNDYLLKLPITRENLEMIATPERLHRHVMNLLPDLGGRSSSIRADTHTVFRVDLPTDRFGTRGEITIRLRSPALDTGLPLVGTPTHLIDGTAIVVQVAADRRRTLPDGIKTTPVPDVDAAAWARHLLTRQGLDVAGLRISTARRFGSRHRVHFTVRELSATLTVTDPAKAAHAYTTGIGRGRAYGLGLIIPLPQPANLDSGVHS